MADDGTKAQLSQEVEDLTKAADVSQIDRSTKEAVNLIETTDENVIDRLIEQPRKLLNSSKLQMNVKLIHEIVNSQFTDESQFQ